MKKIKQFLKKEKLIIFVFSLAFLAYFWKVADLFYFGIDEEYQSLLGLSIIKDFHPVWIGLSAGNTGFYVAPGFVYLHALLLWLSHLDPIILGYAASFTALLTVITLYFVARNLYGKKIAFLATVRSAFFPFVLFYSRRFWNPTLAPLVSLLFAFCCMKAIKDGKWHLGAVFFLAIAFHIHASLLIFIPIYFLFLTHQFINSRRINIPIVIVCSAIFLVIYSPLIVYDLVHNFDNLKTPFRLLQQKGSDMHFNDYYLFFLMPQVAILVAWLLRKINAKLLIVFSVLYILNGLFTVLNWNTEQGLAAKKTFVMNTIQRISNKTFYLDTDRTYLHFGGWRYLFEAYGEKPSSSKADEMFGWIYPKEIDDKKPEIKVTVSKKGKQFKAIIRNND